MKTREYVPSQTDAPVADVCVSFNGGAWRGVFFLGVVRYLQTHFKEEELRRWSFCGVSAGSCYALALALNVPFQRLRTLLLEACRRARESPLGVAFQVNVITGEIIRQMLASYSEEDVVSRLRGRFAVTFTARLGCRLVPFLAYDFDTKEEVFSATVGSANIPLFSSLTDSPRLNTVRAFDGGMTPLGCAPLLPSKSVVSCVCFGEAVWGLPSGVDLDICETPPVPWTGCFRTPSSDSDVDSVSGRGYLQSLSFFTSPVWKDRYRVGLEQESRVRVSDDCRPIKRKER